MAILFCLAITALAAYMVRRAVVVWRDPREARNEADGWGKLGTHGAWAVTRGIVPLAGVFVCVALMTLSSVGAEAWGAGRGPLETAGAVFLAVMLVCWLVLLSIAVLNRPRFVVPPYLRRRRRL
ncbi:hypothetical protein GCM10018777_36150 [Streptomyces albogriseolus]|uniref:hypothetical protein n=1 Tax=Streptomyces albogriseolus TaxID=1887 RepID=UPI001674AC29|nr:hypothetical protein [Streptomyces viridodiastaticus]GHG18712.1 hypothetical protein GCM10018777_36150 [Streptomyces viridodiastaticus]